MSDTDDIKTEFMTGALGYLDAIAQLECRGVDSKSAESLVLAWENEVVEHGGYPATAREGK